MRELTKELLDPLVRPLGAPTIGMFRKLLDLGPQFTPTIRTQLDR
jgi:hypothetical protein